MYALGILLYEMVVGQNPWEANNLAYEEIFEQIKGNSNVLDFDSRFRLDAPPEEVTAVRKAIERSTHFERNGRLHTVDEMAVLLGGRQATPSSTPQTQSRQTHRAQGQAQSKKPLSKVQRLLNILDGKRPNSPKPEEKQRPLRQHSAHKKKQPEEKREWTDPVTGMEFVQIPEGCFQMGSPDDEEGRYSDEGPLHKVCLDGFWLGRYEVTNAQYRKWKYEHDSKDYKGHSLNGYRQPAVYVSWEDANAFAEWLTEQHDGKYIFGLPSEAQWEYAARAGTTTSRFWGDDPNDAWKYANVHDLTSKQTFDDFTRQHHDCNDGYAVTAPVGGEGRFRPNAFGVYDMLGNVWEWCADWYSGDIYAQRSRKESVTNPVYVEGGALRVLRGGSWYNEPVNVRSGYRFYFEPSNRYKFIGFRLVRTVSF